MITLVWHRIMIGLVGAKPGALETRRVGWTLSYGGDEGPILQVRRLVLILVLSRSSRPTLQRSTWAQYERTCNSTKIVILSEEYKVRGLIRAYLQQVRRCVEFCLQSQTLALCHMSHTYVAYVGML